MTEEALREQIGRTLAVRLDARTNKVDHVGTLTYVGQGCADFSGRVYSVTSIAAVEPQAAVPATTRPAPKRKSRRRRPGGAGSHRPRRR